MYACGSGRATGLTSTNRLIVLLSAMSRLMASILAMRLRQHAEDTNRLPAYQWGFRPNRSTLDVILILHILIDLAVEILPREQPPAEDLDPLQFILLDIQKAYPSRNREAAWSVFTRHFGILFGSFRRFTPRQCTPFAQELGYLKSSVPTKD